MGSAPGCWVGLSGVCDGSSGSSLLLLPVCGCWPLVLEAGLCPVLSLWSGEGVVLPLSVWWGGVVVTRDLLVERVMGGVSGAHDFIFLPFLCRFILLSVCTRGHWSSFVMVAWSVYLDSLCGAWLGSLRFLVGTFYYMFS